MFNGKKIGLALSGGGALGVAHIGVIEELEKNGVKIDFVCGTSSGAIIGLPYAAGGLDMLHKFYDDALANFAQKNRFLFAKGPDAAFKYIEESLQKLCAGKDFSGLKTSFACCATNLATGEMEILDKGDPVRAVMASSAYPGVFAAQKVGNDFYIDGGVTRNLPAAEVRAMGAEFVIGSSIYSVNRYAADFAGKMNRFEVAARALDIYEKELSRFEEKYCDFCFKPAVRPLKWFDFFKMNEIVAQGRQNAAKEAAGILSLINK
ncbi:MAG: patatin-like phospholipase family protein [Candidatus Pacebacteria bacterium]|jgi:NTE family protein|nr:patatin-like phospholipase family protein [Candidatus Paceibacterota bacterium]